MALRLHRDIIYDFNPLILHLVRDRDFIYDFESSVCVAVRFMFNYPLFARDALFASNIASRHISCPLIWSMNRKRVRQLVSARWNCIIF